MDIILRKLQSNDSNYFYKWIKDKDVIRYSLTLFQNLKTDEDISNWFDTVLEDKKSYSLGIYDNTNKTLLGYAGISAISQVNNSGEYFIFIGDKSYHGKGVGTYVTKEIIRLGFEELSLNRIMLTAAEKILELSKLIKKLVLYMKAA